MNRKSITLLALVSLSWAGLCHGAVFQHDWKTPGDGLLTFDDVNQREWLDLSQTVLFEQFPGNDQEAKYQYVVAQTNTGGIFEGFSAGKSSDVTALAQSAGINTSTSSYTLNGGPTLALEQLLGITHTIQSTTLSEGMIDEVRQTYPAGRLVAVFRTTPSQAAGLIFPSFDGSEYSPPPPSVMLFRAVVPEPASALLAIAAVLTIGCRRARRRLRFL